MPAPIRAYWERLKARPGYRRALDAEARAAAAQGVSAQPAPLG